MNTFLWILQIVLSIKFLSAAYTHALRQDKQEMRLGMQKMGAPARPLLVLVAVGLCLGSAGLVLPGVMDTLTWLTPWAAATLAGMMLASIIFHHISRDHPKVWVSLILFALCALVAYGRWVIAPG
jgi:uncharacterized membrane protein YphA (DoxX/SURF4 family)